MRKTVLAAILAMTATSALAQVGNNLFISPCGEPFVAPATAVFPIVDWFNGADTNHDGRVDAAEFAADTERFFNVLDRNHDGVIDERELRIYEHVFVPEILPREGADAGGMIIRVLMQYGSGAYGVTPGAGGGTGSALQIDPNGGTPEEPSVRQRLDTNQGAVQFSLFQAPEPVAAADRNLDGKISLKEFRDLGVRRFAALDIKMRGYILLDDLPQTPFERLAKGRRK